MDLGVVLYRLKNKLYDFRNFFIYNLYGRFKYGFDIKDTWNLDYSIAKFIYPRLKYYRDVKPQGFPGVLTLDDWVTEQDLDKYRMTNIKNDDTSVELWLHILDVMIIAFEKMQDDNYMVDEKGQDEISEGLRLFGIFMQHLWD